MKLLKVPFDELFRPREGSYWVSFVPKETEPFITYDMHWITAKNRNPEPFLCYPIDCPICELSRNNPELRKKSRVLINVWLREGSSPYQELKVWDINLYLLTRAFDIFGESRASATVWDPSERGTELAFSMTRRGTYPELILVGERPRQVAIPEEVLNKAYNLQDLIIFPSIQDYMVALDRVINSAINEEIAIAGSVGDVEIVTKLTITKTRLGQSKKDQEPEPYKRVKRVIIMEDD